MAVMGKGCRHREEGYPQSPWLLLSAGEFGRPKSWYRDVSDADKAAEAAWLRANVTGPGQALWGLRITARDRYSDRCWAWGERLGIALEGAVDRSEGRWSGAITPDIVQGQNDKLA
jgi:hypothetical protein